MAEQRVAVVGAGAAGLSAAWRLAEAGAAVTVYEAASQVGGLLKTAEVGGCAADVGAQMLASDYSETRALAAASGNANLLVRAPGVDALWRGGRAHEIAYGSSASMIATSALPFLLKARLGASYLPYLLATGDLSVNEPVNAVRHDRESIAQWGRREMGTDFVELFAYPLLASYYGVTPEQTSAGFFHSMSHAGLGVELLAVRGGMGALATGIGAALERAGAEMRTRVEASRVEYDEAGARVVHAEISERYDGVVLAVPAPHALRLASLPAAAEKWLGQVRAHDRMALALVLRGPLGRRWFGLSFPRGSRPGGVIAAACQQSRKGASIGAQAGREVLIMIPSPSSMRTLMSADDADVVAEVMRALTEALPEVSGLVEGTRVFRFPDSGIEFGAGYLQHLSEWNPGMLPPRLEMAGAFLVAPTVEGAVRSGAAAAKRLLLKLRSRASGGLDRR